MLGPNFSNTSFPGSNFFKPSVPASYIRALRAYYLSIGLLRVKKFRFQSDNWDWWWRWNSLIITFITHLSYLTKNINLRPVSEFKKIKFIRIHETGSTEQGVYATFSLTLLFLRSYSWGALASLLCHASVTPDFSSTFICWFWGENMVLLSDLSIAKHFLN